MDLEQLKTNVAGKIWREDENFKTETLDEGRLPEVLKLLRDNFYQDETLIKSQLSKVDFKTLADDYDKMMAAIFQSFHSIGVIEKSTNKLVALNMLSLFERSKGADTNFLLDIVQEEVTKRVIRFLVYLDERSDLFNRYSVDTLLEYFVISVDRNYRKRGFASQLMQCGVDFAKTIGVSVVYGCYSSLFTRRAAEKVGKELVIEIDLNTYKEEDKVVFENTEPHNVTAIMAVKL